MATKTTMYIYPVIIEPAEEAGYFASCPVLQGCHAEGETYGVALDNLREVIIAHIEARKAHHEPLPAFTVTSRSDASVQIPLPVVL